MNCDAFVDRLYDEDARAAARGLGDIPADVAAHMVTCHECRVAYESLRADDLLLTRALLDVPPARWRAEALQQISRPPRPSWSQRIATVNEVVIWGILAVAASHVLLGENSTAASTIAFCAGGTAALLRPDLTKHWQAVRRPPRWV